MENKISDDGNAAYARDLCELLVDSAATACT